MSIIPNIYIEPDTTKINIFISFFIIVLFFLAIINTSFKDTSIEQETNSPEWGSQLLVILLIISFAYASYSLNNEWVFISSIFIIFIIVI
jgi:glucose uptake protein GlcU